MSDKNENNKNPAASLSRRGFIKGVGGSIVVAPAFIRGAHGSTTETGTSLFATGVASGDPGSRSVVLQTRLTGEDPLDAATRPDEPIPVGIEIATDPGMINVIRRGGAIAHPQNGLAIRVTANRLPPNQWLWYRFYTKGRYRGHESRIGRTRCFPAARHYFDDDRDDDDRSRIFRGERARTRSMRFAVVSCQNYTQGEYPAWADIAAQDLDYVVHTGDYIYEGSEGSGALLPGREHNGPEIVSVEEYRSRYALYRLDKHLQDAHARFPFIVTWDDHEVENNYAGLVAEEGSSIQGDAFAERRRNAYQVYGEEMPLRASSRLRNRDGSFQLFRRLQFGSLADIHVLDTRQYRTDQPAGDGFGSIDDLDPTTEGILEGIFGEQLFDPAIEKPFATMLGFRQEIWLALNLIRSRAKWNVLAQQIMQMQWNLVTTAQTNAALDIQGNDSLSDAEKQQLLAVLPALTDVRNVDAWDGYVAAQERFTRMLDLIRPGGPVVLTGDIHSAWGANLLTDYDDPMNTDVVGAEFVCTSIASTFLTPNPVPTDFIVRLGLPDNPHIQYFNALYRGYCLCDVDDHEWTTSYRGVVPFSRLPGLTQSPFDLTLVPREDDPVVEVALLSVPAGFNERGETEGVRVVSDTSPIPV